MPLEDLKPDISRSLLCNISYHAENVQGVVMKGRRRTSAEVQGREDVDLDGVGP